MTWCAYGAHAAQYARFQKDSKANAEFIRREGMAKFTATYGHGPTRVQFQNKDPRRFAEYNRQLSEHSVAGSANTMEGNRGRHDPRAVVASIYGPNGTP